MLRFEAAAPAGGGYPCGCSTTFIGRSLDHEAARGEIVDDLGGGLLIVLDQEYASHD